MSLKEELEEILCEFLSEDFMDRHGEALGAKLEILITEAEREARIEENKRYLSVCDCKKMCDSGFCAVDGETAEESECLFETAIDIAEHRIAELREEGGAIGERLETPKIELIEKITERIKAEAGVGSLHGMPVVLNRFLPEDTVRFITDKGYVDLKVHEQAMDIRGEICKIISEMLDNPGECEIYPTGKCYDQLEAFISKVEREARIEELLGAWDKPAEYLEHRIAELREDDMP